MNDKSQTETTCPLCGADNQCAVAAGRPAESCWCYGVQMEGEALEKAKAITDAQCVCPACGLPVPTEEAP